MSFGKDYKETYSEVDLFVGLWIITTFYENFVFMLIHFEV